MSHQGSYGMQLGDSIETTVAKIRAREILKDEIAGLIAAEREACALIADQVAADAAFDPSRELAAERIADAIRARARKEKTE